MYDNVALKFWSCYIKAFLFQFVSGRHDVGRYILYIVALLSLLSAYSCERSPEQKEETAQPEAQPEVKEPRSVEPQPVSEEKRIEGEISKLSETEKEFLSELTKIKAAKKELSKKLARLVKLNKIEAARLKSAEEKPSEKGPAIGPPEGATAVAASHKKIDLSWAAPSGGEKASEYNVYRDGKLIGSVKDASFSLEDLKPGTSYCYQISAVDPDGNESRKTKRACAKTSALTDIEQPKALTVESAGGSIDLSWDTADDASVAGFNVYRDGVFLKSVTGTSFSQGDVDSDTSYCYEITAYDA